MELQISYGSTSPTIHILVASTSVNYIKVSILRADRNLKLSLSQFVGEGTEKMTTSSDEPVEALPRKAFDTILTLDFG